MSDNWFEIDREGLAALMARKGPSWVLFELLQNAWDEPGVTEVKLSIEPLAGSPCARIVVEDDAPEGFVNLTHAWTLFASTRKRANPEQRGRFNLGEKLVLAVCRRAKIETTTGSISFDKTGRHKSHAKRASGSRVEVEVRMPRSEVQEAITALNRMIPPRGIATLIEDSIFSSRLLTRPEMLTEVEASMATEIAAEDGSMRPTQRKTRIEVYEPVDGPGEGWILEMGIPVVRTGDRFTANVMQKVPLNMERDNVTPAYLKRVRALLANVTTDLLEPAESSESWVREAASSSDITVEAFNKLVDLRYGEKRVMADPSDPEATKRAIAAGYQPVYGIQLTAGERANLQRARAEGPDPIRPAGQTKFKTHRPLDGGPGARVANYIAESRWTVGAFRAKAIVNDLAYHALNQKVNVAIISEMGEGFGACYGGRTLTFNVARLGWAWFDGNETKDFVRILQLIIHELAHEKVSDHLSDNFHKECCRIGAVSATLPNLLGDWENS